MTHVKLSLHDLSQLVVLQKQCGKNKAEIVGYLVARGWPEPSAEHFVDMTLAEEHERQKNLQEPEEDQTPDNQTVHFGQESWRIILVILLVTAIFIVCMLAAYAR